MKVYLHYEDTEPDDLKMTVKLSLPKSWKNGPFKQLKEVLIENYNKKHFKDLPQNEQLQNGDFHLEKKDGTVMPTDAVVSKFVVDGVNIISTQFV